MTIDVELSAEEISNLEKGGFFVVYLFNDIKITITKDNINKIQEEN